MKILLSWSSGKDSAWALHLLNQQHPGAVAALLTTVNEAMDRVAMHGVRRSVLEAQAGAARLPLLVVHLPHPCSNEVYEAKMRAAVADARANGFTHAAFGDLFLEDIRRYREDKLAGSGLEPLFPVWGIPTGELAQQMIDGGLRARLACVDTRRLDGGLPDANSIATCCASCRPTSIPVASAANSTRACTTGRCSRCRSRFRLARRMPSRRTCGAI
jgi:diphthamide synthase (EF-2-diphthine--ammonia ligase)